MENNDDQCFKWAVTRALHPVDRDAGQISKILRKQSENFNWDNIEFPMKIKDISIFEMNNNINVNDFSYNETKKIYTLRLSNTRFDTVINLFYFDDHYGVVKNLSRLVSSQKSKNKRPKFICMRCLNHFGSEKVLENHLEWCSNMTNYVTFILILKTTSNILNNISIHREFHLWFTLTSNACYHR